MKKILILCVMCFALVANVYPEVLASFPELVRPYWLQLDDRYVYISDLHSVSVYDMKTFKRAAKLGRQGEGPGEFKGWPRIMLTNDKLVLNDLYKILIYSKSFELLQEIKLISVTDRVYPVEDNFVFKGSRAVDREEYNFFTLYNSKLEKIKDLVREPDDENYHKYFNIPFSQARTWKDKVFISQPRKGFYIEVFNKDGKKLYHIEKEVEKVKSEEKHRRFLMEDILHIVGRSRFESAKNRGAFDRPMPEFLAPIKNLWVTENRIYVKTHDITDTKEKFIILDIKGNILETVFLPKTYRELLTFRNNKFYYLEENEDDEVWELHELDL